MKNQIKSLSKKMVSLVRKTTKEEKDAKIVLIESESYKSPFVVTIRKNSYEKL